MPSMTKMPGGSGDPGSAILFSCWTVSFSVSNGKGISVWSVSADADSADITSGGSSVSMSTVSVLVHRPQPRTTPFVFLAVKLVSH